jgi:hypothetical protein
MKKAGSVRKTGPTCCTLARHATAKPLKEGKLSAAGANAIQKRAGLTNPRAVAALDWLRKPEKQMSDGNGTRFISCAEEVRERAGSQAVPEHFGHGKNNSKRTKVRWWLAPFKDPLYLANALIDGIGAGKETPHWPAFTRSRSLTVPQASRWVRRASML